jgi:ubiquinone/menaquinone biosynthesis C-methylase UbiE
MAATYGFVNLISSFGFTARWRHQAVAGLPLESAACVIDLMSGTGELWRSLAWHVPPSACVTGVDFSAEMVRRVRRTWPFKVDVQQADALAWDFPASSADVVVSSFGIKTLSRDQQRRLAQSVARWLKPGGCCSFVEISVPSFPPLRWLYMLYLHRVIPVIGWICMGNAETYRMLGVYTEAFGNSTHFAGCLADAGLESQPVSYFGGCATGVRGRKA